MKKKKKVPETVDSRIKTAFELQLKALTAQSLRQREAILTAKTSLKKDYFTKKLRKTNNMVANLLVLMDQYRIGMEQKAEPSMETAE